jgi:hypothetical protein
MAKHRSSPKKAARHIMLGLSEKISNTMGARVRSNTAIKIQSYKNGIVIGLKKHTNINLAELDK